MVLIDVTPLKTNREYRLLFFGQLISFLGSMISYVAIPYQVFQLTHDNAMVGMISVVQVLPVLIFGILGGTYADRLNRRKLLLVCEFAMGILIAILLVNSSLPQPSIPVIFVVVAIMQSVLGFHRPAMEALTQSIVKKEDYGSIGALGSFRYSFGAILGPLLGGILVSTFGVKGAFIFDIVTYTVALSCLSMMRGIPPVQKSLKSPVEDAKEGLTFALSKPELVGTYIIDIVAMIFAFPVALFPAMSENWGGPKAAGILFSAMAIGSLFMTLFSGLATRSHRHGRGVVISAAAWGFFMIGVGFAKPLWLCVLFLALAGAADMLSGLYRGIIWNESVPNAMRGRLSGIEMISYMTGPLLGNGRAGLLAAKYSVNFSLISGGVVCFIAVVITAVLLPRFWLYKGQKCSA